VKGTDLPPEPVIVGKYSIGNLIAVGNYGKVKKAKHIETGLEVAVKIINKKLMTEDEVFNAMREIAILSSLNHPNVIRFCDLVDTGDRLYMFMEYIKGSQTLKQYMEEALLSEDQTKHLFKQIALAMKYCHDMDTVHRDIKPSNILVSSQGEVKLIDFGLSSVIDAGKLQNTFCGSPSFVAPEILEGKSYVGKAADIYSLAVVLYLMVAHVLPFENLQQTLTGVWVQPDKISAACKDLLCKILITEPLTRLTIQQILAHEWLS